MNKKITVSTEVAAAVAASKKTADELLREALLQKSDGLVTKEGVIFPNGTALLSWYKDRAYYANVSDGTIEIMGEHVDTMSAAAQMVTKGRVNGWEFWKCRRPGDAEFIPVKNLRKLSLIKPSIRK